MEVILIWLLHLFKIQYFEEQEYKLIKAEYDKLKDVETTSTTKKYHDRIILFPDVTWDNSIVEIAFKRINSIDKTIKTVIIPNKNVALRDEIKESIIKLVTTCAKKTKSSKKHIVNFFNTDNTTTKEFKAVIEQLKALGKKREENGDVMACLMCEEVEKVVIKMGKDSRLTASEKQERLKKHCVQLPYSIQIPTLKIKNTSCAYMYVVFRIGERAMKTKIIKVTRKKGEKQVIQNLEEYELETINKKGMLMKGKHMLFIAAAITIISILAVILIKKYNEDNIEESGNNSKKE
ncbi:hypothetical protein ECANGB1_2075 [Enterospora canceri]|uniref:Uncharacterized protein n=1 Tax=Enterospora canceri TaxID=1081671 RepID=A0A1Y1S8R4_9MICR|nr:hypothetical protein ECANGB1_2075 [Enterospora canceri]